VKLMEAILTQGMAVVPPPRAPRAGEPAAGSPEPPAPEVHVGAGPLKMVQGSAEQMFLDIQPEQTARLPRYEGDLLLIEHSAGSITSQAYVKRWNRRNEQLADAAERASVAAAWLGGRPYPREQLNRAWTLVMGSQFHDILPGTSLPKAYEYSWNDQLLALNQFASVLTSASTAIAAAMDTQAQGAAVVVYNPLNIAREDVVEARLPAMVAARAVHVLDPTGREVPAQVSGGTVLFLARVPAVGFAVYDVRPADVPPTAPGLKVNETSLENVRYRIRLGESGDMESLFDKALGRELLSAPMRLAFQNEKPVDWPAWNMDWADRQKPPRGFVTGPARVKVVERGPVRVAVEVSRESEGSRFVQSIRLAAGEAGERVEFSDVIEWRTKQASLKATFPLSASNPKATYSWEVGTVERGNNDERKFEVPSHHWVDLTDAAGRFGVTVLTGTKIGSDKPDDRTLRLTLLFTPGIGTGNGRQYADQATQDWGRHEITYGLAGHAGDWREAGADWQALRLDQPLVAFESPKHAGSLGRSFSLLNVSHSRVRVLAVKKAEGSDEVVIRVVEMDGRTAPGVRLTLGAGITGAREVNGAEEPVGGARVVDKALTFDLTPYQLRSFALSLAPPATKRAPPQSWPLSLPWERSVASPDGTSTGTGFDAAGRSLPAELLPREVIHAGIRFQLAPAGRPNAVVAHGQTIALPAGPHCRLYLLAASADGDRKGRLRIGDRGIELTIQDWSGYVGQWDNRLWATKDGALEYAGLVPGYVKRAPVAWFASHRHAASGANEPYAYAYLFAYSLDLTATSSALTLPDDDRIHILAVTLSDEGEELRPARPLYDTLEQGDSGGGF
jgi:alpha-mannosidase